MKKFTALGCLYLIVFLQSCCRHEGFTTIYRTIESARGLFYSYNEHGIYPYLEVFDRNELGFSIGPDSVSRTIEVSQLLPPMINSALACQNPKEIINVNFIDSVNVFTKYNFNEEYQAGSNINDLLLPLDIYENPTYGIDINQLQFFHQYFKFSAVPSADSMQFVITGRITDKGIFQYETELTVLTN